MITRDNIKELLQSLKQEEVEKVISEPEDFILMELHISNSGSVIMIESREFDEDVNEHAGDNGDLFCDKDAFLQLAKECDIDWNL